MQFPNAGTFGADKPLAEGVVFVSPNGKNISIFMFDGQATHGFTEVTDAVVERHS
jgi:hypothetical protein